MHFFPNKRLTRLGRGAAVHPTDGRQVSPGVGPQVSTEDGGCAGLGGGAVSSIPVTAEQARLTFPALIVETGSITLSTRDVFV